MPASSPAALGRAILVLLLAALIWVNSMPFFAVLWAMPYDVCPTVGGLVALGGVVYMQWRKLQSAGPAGA